MQDYEDWKQRCSCIYQAIRYCFPHCIQRPCYCARCQLERSWAYTEPASCHYCKRDGWCYTFNPMDKFQGQAAFSIWRICELHCREAHCECKTCVRDYSPTIISTDIFTTPVTHPLITLHNGNAEVHAYILEQSIGPKYIQN